MAIAIITILKMLMHIIQVPQSTVSDFNLVYLQTGNVWNISCSINPCLFLVVISGLHSKAAFTVILNQYWRSKSLVLCVYRSIPSDGLCLLCTFWSPSVCFQRDQKAGISFAFIFSWDTQEYSSATGYFRWYRISDKYK